MANKNDVPPGFNNGWKQSSSTESAESTSIIQLLEARCQFYGLPIKDPNAHLVNFLEVCSTFKLCNMTEDEVLLRLFPFSLRDRAKFGKRFHEQVLFYGKTAKLTRDIMLYQQNDGESVHEAWGRYKEMQRKVPHHHITRENLIQNLYNGSTELGRSNIDAVAGGSLMRKRTDAAFSLLDEMAINGCTWPTERVKVLAHKGVMEVSIDPAMESLKVKNASLQVQVDILKRQVAGMNMGNVAVVQSSYEVCGDSNHATNDYYVMGQTFNEQVNFVGGQRPVNVPYAVTYNPGWRNYPNFS
ncbi:uncharacterized protein LOC126672236 [Mercurialis annua]|uniref:uncharacterized protein LOC126672236 n=1 Tax=Mercurialis annua TaxID=3986 RepID=UPI002160BFFD|nr:uncharacterized protein LOC126672236 [Mercurialis annua]